MTSDGQQKPIDRSINCELELRLVPAGRGGVTKPSSVHCVSTNSFPLVNGRGCGNLPLKVRSVYIDRPERNELVTDRVHRKQRNRHSVR